MIPVSGGDAARQIMVLKDFGVSAICCTPSYFLHLVERAEKMGVDLRGLPLRVGAFVGEPWSEAMRRRIEESAGIKAYDIYGLPEIIGPGMGAECCHQNGLHVFEDHFFPEIVDPATGEPLPDGQEGELVLTTLSKEAMPMIRYRTRDLTAIYRRALPVRPHHAADPPDRAGAATTCSSSRASTCSPRRSRPPCWPSRARCLITRSCSRGRKGSTRSKCRSKSPRRSSATAWAPWRACKARLAQEIEQTLGIGVAVRLVEPHTIERSQGKARRVIDKRGT